MQAIINNLQKERNAKRYNREVTLPPMTYSGLSKIKNTSRIALQICCAKRYRLEKLRRIYYFA